MPQFQVLQPGYSFGAELGKALGGGFSEGLSQGLSKQLGDMYAKKEQIEKNKQFIFKNLPEVLKRRGLEDIGDYRKIEKDAIKLASEGRDLFDILDYVSRGQQEPETGIEALRQAPEQKQAGIVTPFGQDIFSKENLEGGLENIKGGVAKGGRAVARAVQSLVDLAQKTGVSSSPIRIPVEEVFDKLTGNRGQPQNIVERIVQGFPFGPAGIGMETANELSEALNLPEPVKELVGMAAFLAAGKGSLRTPKLRAVGRTVRKAEQAAASTGRKVEQVLAEAQSKSGANLEKAAAGDAAEINKLSRSITKEAPKVAEKVKETPKTVFNAKQAAKERKVFGERLPQSPLDVYLKPEKPVAHTAETLAKQEGVIKELTPKQDALFESLNRQKDDLRKLQFDLNRASPEGKPRVQALFKDKQQAIQKTVKDLKDIQYEMKYFRKRLTDEEIASQIEKSAAEFRKEAGSPTKEGQQKISRQLDLDKQYLERAEKILNRGELPGEISPDTHIKMKKKYADGYREIIKQNKDAMADLKGAKDAESLKKIANIRKENGFLETRLKRLDADIVNQTDKIKAMRGIEPPSGAFYRQQLKSLRNDLDLFKKDFFEARRANRPQELKTQKAGREAFKEIKELGERLKDKPTLEDAQKLAEKAGIPKEEFNKTKMEVEKIVRDKTQSGASEKEIVDSIGEKWGELPKKAESLKSTGLRKIALREMKLAMRTVLRRPITSLLTAFGISGYGIRSLYRQHVASNDVESYKKAIQSKRGSEVQRVKNELKAKGLSDAKINELRKRAVAEINLKKQPA